MDPNEPNRNQSDGNEAAASPPSGATSGATGGHDRREVAHRTIAWYGSAEEVRSVEVDLERHGIDGVSISLPTAGPGADVYATDTRTGAWAFRRAIVGVVLGLLLGAAVGLLAGLLLADGGGSIAAFALGGAVFGIAPGLFYMVASGLPAEPRAFDTFAADVPGDNWIAVKGDPEVTRTAEDVMRSHGPSKVVTS